MRNQVSLKSLPVILMGWLLAGLLCSTPASAGVSFSFFYSDLNSYGDWLVSGSYGRVWQPANYRADWNPYYDGQWAYTDLGWMWQSDYPWDVCYHYGTWTFDPVLGWVWVPGYTWAPSWVVFREGPDYIGWEPVPPGFSVGASFNFGDLDDDRFVFVPARDFVGVRVRDVAVPVSETRVFVDRTRIINNNIRIENNFVVNRGPAPERIQQAVGRPIRPVPVERVPMAQRMSRDEIRVEPGQGRHELRAAEPVSARTPLPSP